MICRIRSFMLTIDFSNIDKKNCCDYRMRTYRIVDVSDTNDCIQNNKRQRNRNQQELIVHRFVFDIRVTISIELLNRLIFTMIGRCFLR
jgi:hypothetical protein